MRTENHAEDVEHALALLNSDTMKRVTLSRRQALQGMLLGAAGMSYRWSRLDKLQFHQGRFD